MSIHYAVRATLIGLVILFALVPESRGVGALAQSAAIQTTDSMQVRMSADQSTTLYQALLLPGRSQLKLGRRATGTGLATAAFISVLGLGGTQWLFARQTEQAVYLQEEYANAALLYPLSDYIDAEGFVTEWKVYRDWENAYNDAKRMRRFRTYALAGVGVVYLLNAADVIRHRSFGTSILPVFACSGRPGICTLGGRLVF